MFGVNTIAIEEKYRGIRRKPRERRQVFEMIAFGRKTGIPRLILLALATLLWRPSVFAQGGRSETINEEQRVTLSVENAEIAQVLNAFSVQTGRSVVIGPEVTGVVNMRLKDVLWKEALDVVLRPYGYGYQVVGQTIIVNDLESIQAAEVSEQIVSRVFRLKYLDASDVRAIIESQLSPRGSVNIISLRGQKGWEFESTGGAQSTRQGISAAKRLRESKDEQQIRTKTLVVTDIAAVLSRVEDMLKEVDIMPQQILIEATFVEVNSDFLQDLGVEFGTGATGAESPGVETVGIQQGSEVLGFGVKQTSGDVDPASFDALSLGLSDSQPFNAGLSLMFQRLNDSQFQVLMHMLAEDVTAEVLSAPRILTLNNQEAGIVVGTKFPIISSDTSGESATISTTLEYYENIGVQLNVVPQICDNDYINMIVHPAVTAQIGTASARTGAEGNIPLTEYPVLSTRETETQIMVQSGQRIVIGGLLEDQESRTVLKVPLLGDIPLIGRLFHRETETMTKTDLLIILSATIVTSDEMVTEVGAAIQPSSEEQVESKSVSPFTPPSARPVAPDTLRASEFVSIESDLRAEVPLQEGWAESSPADDSMVVVNQPVLKESL